MEQKFNRVDFLAEDDAGDLLLFEIQNTHELDFFRRMAFGTSKVISEYLGNGNPYSDLKKVYSINIVYFSVGQGEGYAYHGTTKFVNMSDEKDILQLTAAQKKVFEVESVHQIFPEYFLLRVNNFNQYAKSSLEEWISFLKTGEIPDEFTAQGLDEAREYLNVDKLSVEERKAYNRYVEDLRFNLSVMESNRIESRIEKEEARAEGRAEGIALGEKQNAIKMARNMKADGEPIDKIIRYTSLTREEVDDL